MLFNTGQNKISQRRTYPNLFLTYIEMPQKWQTHFMSLVFFYTPWKYQTISGFLMFSSGIERDQWYEMDQVLDIAIIILERIKTPCLQN